MADYIGNNNPDGVSFGLTTSEKISFYGITPVAQRSSGSQASVTATATTAMSTTLTISAANTSKVFGFSSSTVGKEIVKCVKEMQVDLAAVVLLANRMRADLVALGLIKGSS
jgi:hypothetical protein